MEVDDAYALVGQIAAHEGAVRAVCTLLNADGSAKYILTGGADAFLRVWNAVTGDLVAALSHDHTVTAIFVDETRQYIVTGCMDCKIRIFNYQFEEVIRLEGHTKGVISFTKYNDYLISGSWDGSARLWDLTLFQCIKAFEGHENGVNVLSLGEGTLVTTSTGEAVNNKPCHFYIRIWNISMGALLHAPIAVHEASIRSIALVEAVGFVTSSNDGTVRLFSSEGDLIETMCHPPQDDGSTPFIMQVQVISPAELALVSVGEDGSAVVWKHIAPAQSIPHPAGLWCVGTLPGGDLYTGAHDGIVRIFSKDPAVKHGDAAQALQAAFAVEVSEAAGRRGKGPSQEDLQKAPRWEQAASRPGTSEAQVCVFNKEGRLIAAQWSGASGAWVEMGEVVGSAGAAEEVDGVPYDVVLPVEIDLPAGGVGSLRIGYNNGENPFVAAQRFIDQHALNQGTEAALSKHGSAR